MNAVISLCHFCEVHGPKILFTTQPFREEEDEVHPESPDSGHDDPSTSIPISRIPLLLPAINEPYNDGEKKFYGNYTHLLCPIQTEPQAEQVCAACTSVGGWQPGFLTNDHGARTSYVSSQYPYRPQVYQLTRQSSLRSLSCEVCPPGREGPIFFGDDDNGYTLSHTFNVRDAKARGFQHLYSIVVVSPDKLLLLNSYDFLVQSLKSVIDKIQSKSNVVFDLEQSDSSIETLRPSTAGRAAMLPQGFLKSRAGTGGSARSLGELTGDADIFKCLHRYFVNIFREQTLRCVELVLEGCPSQDVLVTLEKAAEPQEMVDYNREENGRPHFFTETEETSMVLDLNSLQPLADLQIVSRLLGADRLRRVIYHILIGDQLVVCSSNQALKQRILTAFSALIPRGCVKIRALSPDYQQLYRYNLLGLDKDVELPETKDFVTIHIDLEPNTWGEKPVDLLERCAFQIKSPAELPSQLPFLVDRFESLLLDDSLTVNVLEAVIRSVKEEWLNKAKLIFQFKKQQPMASENQFNRLMTILKCTERDESVLKFWQGGLSKQYKQQVLATIARLKNVRLEDPMQKSV